jgi:hypothetical protein
LFKYVFKLKKNLDPFLFLCFLSADGFYKGCFAGGWVVGLVLGPRGRRRSAAGASQVITVLLKMTKIQGLNKNSLINKYLIV